jgi:hypothetical protein
MAVVASEDQDPDTGLRPKRGGKLNRSETVTVRFDPRLNYLTELAARSQRRTKSSFIEWAVESALKSVTVPSSGDFAGQDRSIDELAVWLWDVDEADRLVSLAFRAPILMTHEEQILWKLIREHGFLWRGRWIRENGGDEESWNWDVAEHRIIMERVREYFEFFKLAAAGEARLSDPDCPVPSWSKTRKRKPDWSTEPDTSSVFTDDLDEDPPF